MTTPPTILALKQSFLEQETRRLSLPLAPSRAWQQANSERRRSRRHDVDELPDKTNEADKTTRQLPARAVEDALFRANQRIRQHARRVYAPQAVRHVAEQLDRLYWQASEDDTAAADSGVSGDYTDPLVVETLPVAWDDRQTAAMPLEARRYAELVEQLRVLTAQRTAATARVQRLRRLAAMVAPLQGANDDRQANVVTRDGPLERELERMRLLLVRVADGVAALQRENTAGPAADGKGDADGAVEDVEAIAQRRTRALLERF